jgi:homoserine O-acetyltransferase
VIWVCHALTANSDPVEWWPGLVGPGLAIDTDRYAVVCANMLGSCYGTTGPLSTDPDTGDPWFARFPLVSVRDMARLHRCLADYLGIRAIDLLIGGSMGGQQALEWAIDEPERISKLALLATNAQHSPWGIGFNETQRMAIFGDPTYWQRRNDGGLSGLQTARAIALMSYRSYESFHIKQSESSSDFLSDYRAASYLRYQGLKLARRFNAYSYVTLTRAMDSHHVGRGRGSVEAALGRIQANTLVIGIESDLLFPSPEQQFLAHHIPQARYIEIQSDYGHDGFLIEFHSISKHIFSLLSE